MKKLTVAALLLGGALMAFQSAIAQNFIPNDLYFGFQNQDGGGTQDYIINLGAGSNIVGGAVVVDLSTNFALSKFNAVLGSSSSMYGGVVGGKVANPSTADIYLTQLRSGGAGTPSVPGSSVSALITRIGIDNAVQTLTQLNAPAANTGILDGTKSWESYVEPTLSLNSFWGECGFNPDSVVDPTIVLYEDLYYNVNGNISGQTAYVYQGYFTLDLTGGSPKLTFTPKNAPAPLQAPVILSINYTGGSVTVIWSTVPTYTYQLLSTPSLAPTNWMTVGSALVASTTTMTNSSDAPDPHRFYKVSAH